MAVSEALIPRHVAEDKVVRQLLVAEKALAAASSIDQVKLVLDVAAAQEVFARRQQVSEGLIQQAHALKTHALARLGELLKGMQKATGGQPYRKGSTRSHAEQVAPSLTQLGISRKEAMVAQQLADLPAATREAIAQRETTLKKEQRVKRRQALTQKLELPDAKYRLIYADPPWQYRDTADEGAIQGKGAAHHYPTMSIEELCALPVRDLGETHSVMALWVTSPLLAECWPVIEAWGYEYKASYVWDKQEHNPGHYGSVQHEFLLICTRGIGTPERPRMFPSVQSIQREEHSRKPEHFRQILDTLWPVGKRIELFARGSLPEGWDGWGNQSG